ncbi:MAG: hypothetical protein V3S30_04450, partial [Thermoanaerobaculia bacterium]
MHQSTRLQILAIALFATTALSALDVASSDGASTPGRERAAAADFQAIEIRAADGVLLAGRYYSSPRPGPGLLFLNMCDPAEDQSQWTDLATQLAGRGFHVVTFDYRGFGMSGGSMPSGLKSLDEAINYWRTSWIEDVEAAFRVLATYPDVISIRGMAAASCGVVMAVEMA